MFVFNNCYAEAPLRIDSSSGFCLLLKDTLVASCLIYHPRHDSHSIEETHCSKAKDSYLFSRSRSPPVPPRFNGRPWANVGPFPPSPSSPSRFLLLLLHHLLVVFFLRALSGGYISAAKKIHEDKNHLENMEGLFFLEILPKANSCITHYVWRRDPVEFIPLFCNFNFLFSE